MKIPNRLGKLVLLLTVISSYFSLIHANVIDIKRFKLAENALQSKSRFVFSDYADKSKELVNATVQFQLTASAENYNPTKDTDLKDKKLRLYLILAEISVAEKIFDTLQQHKEQIDQLGLSKIISPYAPEMAYYDALDVYFDKSGEKPASSREFVGSAKVKKEGVYYSYFIYEQVPTTEEQVHNIPLDNNIKNNTGHHLMFLASRRRQLETQLSGGASSRVATLVVDWAREPHLEINGQIVYKNTYGYINAEQRPLMTFYPVMFVIYLILMAHWCFFMKKYQGHLVNLHFYVFTVILVTLFEAGFNTSYLGYINSKGSTSPVLVVSSFLIEIIRNVFSRVVTLLVGLGYGILIKTIERYKPKIILISFLYSMGLLAHHGILLINQYQPVSGAVAFIVSLPVACMNAIFMIWIYYAFRRTLYYLKSKQQDFKFKIISILFLTFCICAFWSVILIIYTIVNTVSETRDREWQSEWFRESAWMMIYTCFVIAISHILRPNESSDLLSQMQQVLDETLTEMGTIENVDVFEATQEDHIEMHKFDPRFQGESLDSSPNVEGIELEKQMSSDFDGVQSANTVPHDMTIEEFSQIKRRQRMQKKKQMEKINLEANTISDSKSEEHI